MTTCFNCGAGDVELRREPRAPGNEIGGGCPLCEACWRDMIARTDWADGEEVLVACGREGMVDDWRNNGKLGGPIDPGTGAEHTKLG